ncbi:MAG: hypothetical protein K1Y36_15400 [Blastocatellia bacterium]|nr:hypothetical protein [Blastocatellia bacterium]
MDPRENELSDEMILLAESDSFDIFTDSETDLVHLDCYAQGITLHLLHDDFLELVRVMIQAHDKLREVRPQEGNPQAD